MVIHIEMINPVFEFVRSSETKINKNTNKFKKNRKTKNDEFGSVKYTIDTRVDSNNSIVTTAGRKFFRLRTICFLISLCILYT